MIDNVRVERLTASAAAAAAPAARRSAAGERTHILTERKREAA